MLKVLAATLPKETGARVRAGLMRALGYDVGPRCTLMGLPTLLGGRAVRENLHVGAEVVFNVECLVDCSGPVRLDRSVFVGPRVQLITGRHEIGPPECRAGDLRPQPIHVGAGTWVGAGAIILPGVTIGEGCVVASGAVVARDVPPGQLVAGVPARVIRSLDRS